MMATPSPSRKVHVSYVRLRRGKVGAVPERCGHDNHTFE
jgi:hypothetical protein